MLENLVYQLPEEPLSQAEIDGMSWMREEEKLARDVYSISNTLWNRQVFAHITTSEQSHMDGIGYLLEKYSLPDPITSDETGVFSDQALQSLFDSLKIASSLSLIAALETGAWIEELDILDLDEQIELADNQDILLVYENLQKGSRNHLRAFVRNLDMEGVTYQPQLLSEERYLAIINSAQETGID
ncbi:MAG: DUF2202 domain-containing protein [Lewinellaceae bacterium]|nr:DUF2202 domain-containing protein [Lewinellaceae bacterium]